jgi:hypothetical protein
LPNSTEFLAYGKKGAGRSEWQSIFLLNIPRFFSELYNFTKKNCTASNICTSYNLQIIQGMFSDKTFAVTNLAYDEQSGKVWRFSFL